MDDGGQKKTCWIPPSGSDSAAVLNLKQEEGARLPAGR